MREKTKKATFNLHIDVLNALDEAMVQGIAPSKNALVEQALIRELKELRRQVRQTRWKEGAGDPKLIKDIEQIKTDFQFADDEIAWKIG